MNSKRVFPTIVFLFWISQIAFASNETFDEKCAKSGVISCFGFDRADSTRNFPSSGEPLKYTWFTGTACDNAGLGTRYAIVRERSPAEGNALAVPQNGACYAPKIDANTKATGAGSLRIEIPSRSDGQTGGYFTAPLRGLDLPRVYVGPGSPLGNEIWFQWRQRFSASMLNQNFGDPYLSGIKQIILVGEPPGATGDYSYNIVVLNGWLRGVPQFYYRVPEGSGIASPPGEVQNMAGRSAQYPNGCSYGFQPGANSGFASNPFYTAPPCVRYEANKWHEFTLRVKIIGTTSYTPTSLIELYTDGVLVSQDTQARISWGIGGNGYGQFYLDPQATGKNPLPEHEPGTVWFDDVIFSTQPIAMSNSLPTPGADLIPPTVSITSPSNGAFIPRQ